jgi:hypothetical protein
MTPILQHEGKEHSGQSLSMATRRSVNIGNTRYVKFR